MRGWSGTLDGSTHESYILQFIRVYTTAMDLASSQISISNFPGDFSDPVDLDDEAIRSWKDW
jgi:hypothetical protein